MIFHWVAEFATAILLLFSGISLILKLNWGVTLFLVAIGMLIYTLIDSPGYFAQQNKWSMVIMFVALLIAAIVSLVLVF